MHEVVNKIITKTQKISLAKVLDHKAHLYKLGIIYKEVMS
jgi:hypothetical protein